jgi:hypothetical protein
MLNSKGEIHARKEKLSFYITSQIKDSDVVVSGSGGWDDALVEALGQMAAIGKNKVFWCLHGTYDQNKTPPLDEIRKLFAAEEHLSLYLVEHADCDDLFARLHEAAQKFSLLPIELADPDWPDVMAPSAPSQNWREALNERIISLEKQTGALCDEVEMLKGEIALLSAAMPNTGSSLERMAQEVSCLRQILEDRMAQASETLNGHLINLNGQLTNMVNDGMKRIVEAVSNKRGLFLK